MDLLRMALNVQMSLFFFSLASLPTTVISSYEYKLSPASGEFWQGHIYKNVSNVASTDDCASKCTLDGGPCYIFIFEDSYCYLGDWNVEADTVPNMKFAAQAYVRQRKWVQHNPRGFKMSTINPTTVAKYYGIHICFQPQTKRIGNQVSHFHASLLFHGGSLWRHYPLKSSTANSIDPHHKLRNLELILYKNQLVQYLHCVFWTMFWLFIP